MKKTGIIAAMMLSLIYHGYAQQMPLYSQYVMNNFLVNPAIAGTTDYIPIYLTARQMWLGINNAPQTVALSGHTPLLGQRMGLGGFIYTDRFGPIDRTGIMASYSYHINLGRIDSKLSFGLSLSGYQYRIDESKLILNETNDEAITGAVESAFAPDACFGALLYRHNYYVGLAANQLFEFNVGINEYNKNKMIRHYYLTGGYKFKLKMFYFGYAFDYTFGSIADYSYGSHEIMVGVHIGEGGIKGSTLF
ncbi:MAG: type IX secretion system membrane protein PorP/SprF [Bacteroidia bacterium]|nr:type IX secretion system membrane protein PorP/SprF [Bacteroidia bacterium]